eukprot:scaffold114103_cov29-Tisochrysis_lutea.AAC.4
MFSLIFPLYLGIWTCERSPPTQVNCAPFSPDVQSCLPAKGWTIPGALRPSSAWTSAGRPTAKIAH